MRNFVINADYSKEKISKKLKNYKDSKAPNETVARINDIQELFLNGDYKLLLANDELTVLVLDTSPIGKYEQISVMIDKEIESVYCDIHGNELETGFYNTLLLNEQE